MYKLSSYILIVLITFLIAILLPKYFLHTSFYV